MDMGTLSFVVCSHISIVFLYVNTTPRLGVRHLPGAPEGNVSNAVGSTHLLSDTGLATLISYYHNIKKGFLSFLSNKINVSAN